MKNRKILEKVGRILAICVCLSPATFGVTSPVSYDPVPLTPYNGLNSYDPIALTPFNGLKLERSGLYENPDQRNSYDYDTENQVGAGKRRDDNDSQRIYWPFEYSSPAKPSQTKTLQTSPTSDSALFRSTLPENQPRPSTYQASTYSSPSTSFTASGQGFPLLNSPYGVQPGRSSSSGRSFDVDALPPNYYFITKNSNRPPEQFQAPPTNFEQNPRSRTLSYSSTSRPTGRQPTPPRRIPDGLRRTQYYPDGPTQPSAFLPGPVSPSARPYEISYNSASARAAPATSRSFDSTFHSFYAPTYKNYIPITRFHHDAHPTNGEYNVEFQTGNGIYQKESGYIKKISIYNARTRQHEPRDINVKIGTVSWTSPEGIPFTMNYIADENGFRPSGSHIPKTDGSINTILPVPDAKDNYNTVIPSNPLYNYGQEGRLE